MTYINFAIQMNGEASISEKSWSFRYNSCKLCLFFLSFRILQLIFLFSTSCFPPPPLFSAVFSNLAETYTRQWMSGSPHFGVGSLLKGVVCLAHKQMGLPRGFWASRDMGLIGNVWPQHSWSSVWEWIWILCSPVSMFWKQLCIWGPMQLSLKQVVCLVGCWAVLEGPDSAACWRPLSP